jgi:hypothetical protein
VRFFFVFERAHRNDPVAVSPHPSQSCVEIELPDRGGEGADGGIPKAVPVRNSSSHTYNSLRSMGRSTTVSPISRCARVITQSRVMPSRMFSVTGGVISLRSRTMKRLQVAPSATWPLSFSRIASSNPLRRASSLASALLT